MQDHLEVYIQHACTQPVSIQPWTAMWRRPYHRVACGCSARAPAPRNHFEARRVRALERRRRLPQPDVPLPADRDPLRRIVARRRARVPGPHRSDVLGRPRLGADHVDRPHAPSRRSGSTTSRPSRTGASGSRRSASPATSSASRRWRRSTAARSHPGRRSRPTSRSSSGSHATPRPRSTRRARAGWARPTTTRWSTR